jgi:hypothetical protein
MGIQQSTSGSKDGGKSTLGAQLLKLSESRKSHQKALAELKDKILGKISPTKAELRQARKTLTLQVESIVDEQTGLAYDSIVTQLHKCAKSISRRSKKFNNYIGNDRGSESPFSLSTALLDQAIHKVRHIQSEKREKNELKERTYSLEPNDDAKIRDLLVDKLYAVERKKWEQTARERTRQFMRQNGEQLITAGIGDFSSQIRSLVVAPVLPERDALTQAIFCDSPYSNRNWLNPPSAGVLALVALRFMREAEVSADLIYTQVHMCILEQDDEWHHHCNEDTELILRW